MASSSSPSALLSPTSDVDLRHVVSSGALSPQRDSKLDPKTSSRHSHRMGSLSPASMPSSPTSIHSSSSAIFERDIEHIEPAVAPSSSPSHPPNPHRIPRGKATEQLDNAVPSVLDSAATVLATSDDSVAVVAPALPSPELSASRSGLASPASRMSSRSPSPSRRPLKLPSPSPSLTSPLPPLRPVAHTQPSAASSVGPMFPGAYLPTPVASPSVESEQQRPLELPMPTTIATSPPVSVMTSASGLSGPPSPHAASKRLSFISYTDLLSSTPASTLPLSSLTTAATAADPPPHLPTVLGVPQQQQAAAGSSMGGSARSSWYGERDVREGREGLFVDEVGGEWEREGLGQGLEERLESLKGMPPVGPVGVGKA